MLNYHVPPGLRTHQIILLALSCCVFYFAACNKNDPYTSLEKHDKNARVFTIELFRDTVVSNISITALDKTPLYLREINADMLPVLSGYEIEFTESDGGLSVISENIDSIFYHDVEIVDKSGNLLLKPFEIHTQTGRTIQLRGFLTVSYGSHGVSIKADCYEHDLIASMMAGIVRINDPQSFQEALSVLFRTNLYAFNAGASNRHMHESERNGIVLGAQLPQKYHYNSISNTDGYIAVVHAEPVVLYSTEICGGMTATPDMVWQELPSAPNYQVVLCENCLLSGSYEWASTLNSNELGELLFGSYNHVNIWISKIYENGRPQLITAQMGDSDKTFTVEEFRNKIGHGDTSEIILSDWFEIKNDDSSSVEVHGPHWLNIHYNGAMPETEEVLFKGWGIGHGVGLCRESARKQARDGKTFPEIIQYYFPRSQTIRIESE